MSLRPKNGRVALSILGVYTHMIIQLQVDHCEGAGEGPGEVLGVGVGGLIGAPLPICVKYY